MALRQNWYLISCKWLRLTAGQSKKYRVFTKQGHARSYQRITKDMTKLEKIKSPKICLESCSCKITGATTISCVFCFFSAFFWLFQIQQRSNIAKREPTLRRLKASKACSSSAFPCGVVDSGERKKKRRKNWRIAGEFFFVNPQVVVVNRVFFHKSPNLFWFFCVVKKKDIQHSNQAKNIQETCNQLSSPIPPKHTLLENWWRPLLWCFFEWHLGILQMRKMDS